MIAELATDLLAKVQSIGALVDSSSLTLGGRAADPGMLKLSPPFAWVSMRGDAEDEPSLSNVSGPSSGMVPTSQLLLGIWVVVVFIPYINDADMIATQYPLLESLTAAIHAKDAPGGFRWGYVGQKIAMVYPDRLAYEQSYRVNFVSPAAS